MLARHLCRTINRLLAILCIMRHIAVTGFAPRRLVRTVASSCCGARRTRGEEQRSAFQRQHLSSSVFPIYYNDVYHVPLPKNHRFPMEKYGKVRTMVQDELNGFANDSVLRPDFRVSPIVSVVDLTTTHCPDYIARFISGDQSSDEQRNVGFPWSAASVQRTLSSTGGTVAAALDAVQHGSWACHVAGGTHHAFYNRGEGFCIFSDMAVAANVILRDYYDSSSFQIRRILLLDLDVHQGNGNAVLFQHNPNVFTFSLHCAGNYFSTKQQSDLDIELPRDCNDQTYLATLHHWLQRLRREAGGFDLIFYQAGVDIHQNDRLGRMAITAEGIQKRNQLVFDFMAQTPAVICMGGGYPRGDDWSTVLAAHAAVYTGAYHFVRAMKLSPANNHHADDEKPWTGLRAG
jgi:acetoin utilization deacetylase AcuC-like enzyme